MAGYRVKFTFLQISTKLNLIYIRTCAHSRYRILNLKEVFHMHDNMITIYPHASCHMPVYEDTLDSLHQTGK